MASQIIFVGYYFFKKANKINFLARYLILNLIGLNGWLPWLVYVYKLGLAANTQPLIPPPTSFNLLQIYLNFVVGFPDLSIQALAISLWPLFLTILFLVFTRKLNYQMKRADYLVINSFIPVVLVYLISFYRSIFLPRYLILIAPALFILLAWILANFGRRMISPATVLILLIMVVALNLQNNSTNSPIKENYQGVVDTINLDATPRDLVAVTAPFTLYPVEYYYQGLAKMESIPNWNRYIQGPIPQFNRNIFQQEIQSDAKVYDRLFLITSYDQGYQTQIVNYLDKNYQRLYLANYSANIQLRIYKLRYDF